MIKKIINNSYTVNYKYLSNGSRTTELIYEINYNNKINYSYDKLNNITHIYYNGQLLKQYYYDKHIELIKEINYDSNVIYEYTYDSTGNILKEVVKKLSDNSILNTYTYEYENTN